jgi:ribosomal protein S20
MVDKLDQMQERDYIIEERQKQIRGNNEENKKVVKSYKVRPETREKVEALFAQSGMKHQDEWLEKLVLDYEMRELAKENRDQQYLLDTLDYHLGGISTIFFAFLHAELADKKQIREQHGADAEQMRAELEQVKGELTSQLQENREMSLFVDRLKEEGKQKDTTIEQLDGLVKKTDLLVNEYKEKNEALSDLVSKQKQAAEQGVVHAEQAREAKQDNDQLNRQLKDVLQQLESLKESHTLEIERLIEKKDLEREREKLALQAEYQDKLEQVRTELSDKLIKALENE